MGGSDVMHSAFKTMANSETEKQFKEHGAFCCYFCMLKMLTYLDPKRFSELESNDGMPNCKLVDTFAASNKMLRPEAHFQSLIIWQIPVSERRQNS